MDEFQDISAGRMALLRALKRERFACFLVGDDWQSIYRFAGSDVGFLRDCGRHLGHVAERTLTRTFRFGPGLLEPSTAFVTRNPEQTRRALKPAADAPDSGVTVIADEDPARGLREADYAVVLNLRAARRGFPSQHEDDPLLNLVLPPPPAGAYPHAEERRLCYVAMTRASCGAYLVADALRPSAFVDELLRESPGLRRLGEFRRDRTPACPRCRTGRLDVSSSGRSLHCLNFPFCRYRAPRCHDCGRGLVVIAGKVSRCTNASCEASPPVCESCRAGVLVARTGRTGRFLGCSAYAPDQPCTNTRSLAARR